MNNTQSKKGVVALVILAFGFGVIAITARYMSYHFTLFQQLYVSLLVAFIVSIFIFPKTLTLNKLKETSLKDWGVLFFRIFIGYVFGGSLYRESLTLTKISNVTFIQSIPFAAVFGWLIFKEKFTFKKFILILLAYIGVLIISVDDFSNITNFGKGELFSLVSSAFFALSYLSRKWLSNFLNDKEIAQILLFLGTITLFTISLLKGEKLPNINYDSFALLLSVFFTGFFNAINIYLINYGFKRVDAVLASNILTLESIFAVLLAIIFYKEFPNTKELLGGFLIIGSVIQMNRADKR